MKEFTRIITLTITATTPDVDRVNLTKERIAQRIKEQLEEIIDATVRVTKVQDFIKDGDGDEH